MSVNFPGKGSKESIIAPVWGVVLETEREKSTMTVGIVGLGLIGGSLGKSIKKNTTHRILGLDIAEGCRRACNALRCD